MTNIEKRQLGHSGIHVSVIGLGCNQFGSRLDLDKVVLATKFGMDLGDDWTGKVRAKEERGKEERGSR